MGDNLMGEPYARMLNWLEIPAEKNFVEACKLKEIFTTLCIEGDTNKIISFIINKTAKIDTVFGNYTAEQLLQLVL